MVTATTTTFPVLPEYAKQPTADMAATLGELIKQPLQVPQQQVAGFSPTQTAAMQRAYGGIGAYQPFLDAAQASQAAALGTTGAGVQALGQMDFDPARAQAFMDPYQQSVTQEALKEIDRQAAMAGNQLAGKAVQAGAFGGSRFGYNNQNWHVMHKTLDQDVSLKTCHVTINKHKQQLLRQTNNDYNKVQLLGNLVK